MLEIFQNLNLNRLQKLLIRQFHLCSVPSASLHTDCSQAQTKMPLITGVFSSIYDKFRLEIDWKNIFSNSFQVIGVVPTNACLMGRVQCSKMHPLFTSQTLIPHLYPSGIQMDLLCHWQCRGSMKRATVFLLEMKPTCHFHFMYAMKYSCIL